MKTKHATVADMRKLNKIVKKAREGDSVVTFKRIGKLEDIKIIAMSDASFKSVDEKVRSVEGRVIFLSDGVNASPLEWKSKKIPQVCESTKTAETRAADKATDDAIYFARLIKEIYTGVKSLAQIPVIVYTDSKPTIESIHSTRQVDRKTVRHVIQSMRMLWTEARSVSSSMPTPRRCSLMCSPRTPLGTLSSVTQSNADLFLENVSDISETESGKFVRDPRS